MIKIGITGLIGTGKTTISQIFEIFGLPVYNADIQAKQIMHKNHKVKEKLIIEFGEDSYINNQLNKEYISKIIFSDKTARKKINSIVHPAVIEDFKTWLIKKESENFKMICIESALLYAAKIDKLLDYIILVTSEEETLVNRIMKRDNISQEQALQKIKAQKSEIKQEYKADFEIKNDSTDSIILQSINILNKIKLAKNIK
ncbi:MAG: dephospho-CoA kinase [Bacteroidales bacterium]|jgi:dephospho-CoA kinase|nr:dephospho-CoA kinase [Bacteroidales bacterium]MDY0313467.1 dephospho-CoA kinase [Bacteroidales bacterium]NLB86120.1 dephospho-CoA kinase [Bacteroidales bacterium]